MICDCCNVDYPEKDFFLGQKICYRCVYKDKMEKKRKKGKEKVYCRVCKN